MFDDWFVIVILYVDALVGLKQKSTVSRTPLGYMIGGDLPSTFKWRLILFVKALWRLLEVVFRDMSPPETAPDNPP